MPGLKTPRSNNARRSAPPPSRPRPLPTPPRAPRPNLIKDPPVPPMRGLPISMYKAVPANEDSVHVTADLSSGDSQRH
eukprot:IDg4538t1